MKDLEQIKAAYDWMIEKYQGEVRTAAATNDQNAFARLDAYRDNLERGIFVLLFGQFEVELNDRFRARRDNRSSNPDWTVRRGWDTPQIMVDKVARVPFETRLALMIDRRTADFTNINLTYALRNHCAHGGTSQPVGSIDLFINNLYQWQTLMRST
jgi:hypothetical protein